MVEVPFSGTLLAGLGPLLYNDRISWPLDKIF